MVHLLEPRFDARVAGVLVGMKLARQLAVGLLHGVRIGGLGDTESSVEGFGHYRRVLRGEGASALAATRTTVLIGPVMMHFGHGASGRVSSPPSTSPATSALP